MIVDEWAGRSPDGTPIPSQAERRLIESARAGVTAHCADIPDAERVVSGKLARRSYAAASWSLRACSVAVRKR